MDNHLVPFTLTTSNFYGESLRPCYPDYVVPFMDNNLVPFTLTTTVSLLWIITWFHLVWQLHCPFYDILARYRFYTDIDIGVFCFNRQMDRKTELICYKQNWHISIEGHWISFLTKINCLCSYFSCNVIGLWTLKTFFIWMWVWTY